MKNSSVLLSAVAAILGLLLFFNPLTSLMIIIVSFGGWIILSAVNDIYKARRYSDNLFFRRAILIRSIISITIGIIAVILPVQSAGAFVKATLITLAVYFIFKAVVTLFIIIKARLGTIINRTLFFSFLHAIASAIILFILDGQTVATIIIQIIGIIILVCGILFAIYSFKTE